MSTPRASSRFPLNSQMHHFYRAGERIADRDQAMLNLLFGENPITDDELRRLVAKRPDRYQRYAGYLGKRGQAAAA